MSTCELEQRHFPVFGCRAVELFDEDKIEHARAGGFAQPRKTTNGLGVLHNPPRLLPAHNALSGNIIQVSKETVRDCRDLSADEVMMYGIVHSQRGRSKMVFCTILRQRRPRVGARSSETLAPAPAMSLFLQSDPRDAIYNYFA